MSVNPLLLPIQKDTETVKKEVLTNIVKMISYRGWINPENIQKTIDRVLKTKIDTNSENAVYEINLDTSLKNFDSYDEIPDDLKEFDPLKVFVKLLPQKVTGVNKSPQIIEFLNTYKNYHKILVVDSISEKPEQNIDDMKYTEVFKESSLMMNLTEHHASSQYEILSKKESDDFLKSYQSKKIKLTKMFHTDPASRYLYIKVGQIVRCIRLSELSGESVAYHIVKKGSVL